MFVTLILNNPINDLSLPFLAESHISVKPHNIM